MFSNTEFPTVSFSSASYNEREGVRLVVMPTINLGRPQGTVKWTFQDPSGRVTDLTEGVSSNSLTIESVDKVHRGVYTIRVIGEHTNASANFSLNVYCELILM